MEISVVIPVFNAKRFIKTAVDSALAQPEVKEVLLIDDGSVDASYAMCREMADDPRVRLLEHPGHVNKGAAASRNLGIVQASMSFIAFLDADDYFTPNRFEVTKRIFMDHPDADGVHEIIGAYYYDDGLKAQHIARASGENTGIRIKTSPDQLFRVIATGKYGHISLDGLVVRKKALDNMTLLDTELRMGEDSDFILRLAASRILYGGDLSKIVTIRGVHEKNSVFVNPDILKYRRQYLQKCIDHKFYGSQDLIACLYILTRRVGASSLYAPFKKPGKAALPIKLLGITGYLIARPWVLLNLCRIGVRHFFHKR